MTNRARIELHTIGAESVPVVVVDGFARDPEYLRELANAAKFQPMGDFYPGRRAPVPQCYFEDVGQLLGGIFQRAYACSAKMSVERALYSIVSTPPAELSIAQRIPHIDNIGTDQFAMVHYLSHEDFGGTGFYRHRETGFETITSDRHRLYLDRLEQDFSEKGKPKPGYIEGDTALFEQIGLIEHRYNRAVIYPGNLLHCSLTRNDLFYPDDPLAGRLTIAAFMLAR